MGDSLDNTQLSALNPEYENKKTEKFINNMFNTAI